MNWKEWFKAHEKVFPRNDHFDDDTATDHWENMYQAFKARLIEEIVVADERSAVISDGLPYPPEKLKHRKVLLLADTAQPDTKR